MGRGKLANQGRRQESGCLTMEAVLELRIVLEMTAARAGWGKGTGHG